MLPFKTGLFFICLIFFFVNKIFIHFIIGICLFPPSLLRFFIGYWILQRGWVSTRPQFFKHLSKQISQNTDWYLILQ